MRNHRAAKKPGKAEKRISVVVIAMLLVITAGLFHAQRQRNPALLQTMEETFFSAPQSAGGQAGPTGAEAAVSGALPPGVTPLGPTESFTRETLSDKINGKAELYLSAGFVGLDTQRFQSADPSGMWVERYVYDMNGFTNAYAVYSSQRREGTEPLAVTADAYRSANAVFLAHGKHYVEIIASEASDSARTLLEQLARSFVDAHPVKRQAIPERDLFPPENLIPGSITLISTNGFGFEPLDRLFVARYRMGDTEITAFLSRRDDAGAAAALAAAYGAFLLDFDGRRLDTLPPMDGPVQGFEIMGVFELFFTRGPYLAGVHEAEDLERAHGIVSRLYERLKDAEKGLDDGP